MLHDSSSRDCVSRDLSSETTVNQPMFDFRLTEKSGLCRGS